MITSKQIIQISEKYIGTGNIRSEDVPIYANPTYDDLKQLLQSFSKEPGSRNAIRAIADLKTKTLYVWNGYKAVHNDLKSLIPINNLESSDVCKFTGTLFNNRLNLFPLIGDVSKNNYSWLFKFYSYNWSWLDKYSPGTFNIINSEKVNFFDYLKKHDPDFYRQQK